MEQANHLKHTVEKLDHALERLQEIQSTLRGHSPLPGIADLDITLQRPKIPQLKRFDEFGGIAVDQSGDWRRWSTPAPLMHDALSEVVAASKFAKKTVDMVKVQKKQAAKSTSISYTSQAKQASLLHPSNRVNLPQLVMAATDDASVKPKCFSKENRKIPHQSKLDLKDAAEVQTKGGLRSLEKHREYRDEASSSLQAGRSDRHVSFTRVAPEEHVVSSNIIQLRTLMNVDEAANDHHRHGDQHEDCNVHQHESPDHNMHQHNLIDQGCSRQAAASVKRSSLSMRTLLPMEDKEKSLSRPAVEQDKEKDMDSLSSAMASKSFCVQLEEIKSSRKKAWSFSQGKVSDNVVVMFPNPTYDETTPPTSTPPDVMPTSNSTIRKASLQEKVSTFPSTAMMNKPPPLDNKASTQKREKIVRLSPCSTTSNAQKPKPQPAPTSDIASASKRASPKKQKWKCTLTQPPSPTLIRRLPEAHEMKEIKQNRVPSTIMSLPNVSVGRTKNNNKRDGEDRHTLANADHDDGDSKTVKRSWSFGNPSVLDNTPSSSNARRHSLGPPAGGGHSFSFLSKHFHAWKLASKQGK